MITRLFLNPAVEAEVIAEPTLFLAWRLTQPHYDWEIDPLHNPSWVAEEQKREEATLIVLKERVKEVQEDLKDRIPV